MSSQTDLKAGSAINGLYRLVRLVGVGGMGEVWEARHERTKGRVAVKLLLGEAGRDERVLQRFQREIEITSGLNHPNIVRVSDADKMPDGRPFFVMEFLEGQDLSRLRQTAQPIPLAQAVEIVEQAASGLQAAHDQAVVHRDLKPGNLFLTPMAGSGRMLVKILDFGISKALDGLSQLTQTRTVMGTPNYMAPEQAQTGISAVDARSDQFSLGAIAYELLTWRLAFAGDGMINVIFKVVHETPPSFEALGIRVPAGVEAIVMRALSKSPSDRFASVSEFSAELRRAAGIREEGEPHLEPTVAPRTLLLAPGEWQDTPRVATTLGGSAGQIDVSATEPVSPHDAAGRSRFLKVSVMLCGAALGGAILTGVGFRGRGRGSAPTVDSRRPSPVATTTGLHPAQQVDSTARVASPPSGPPPAAKVGGDAKPGTEPDLRPASGTVTGTSPSGHVGGALPSDRRPVPRATKAKATNAKATDAKATNAKATDAKATNAKATDAKATDARATNPSAKTASPNVPPSHHSAPLNNDL